MRDGVRVWAVELGGPSPAEREGFLYLERERITFRPAREGSPGLAIVLRDVTRARRVRGSPVLMIESRSGDRRTRTAFYFAQPPPLPTTETSETRIPLPSLRNPRRKARRTNLGYLGVMNREKKAELVEWERSVRAAVAEARGGR